MRLQLPLSSQVLILVTLPLVVQLVSLAWLASLQNQAEDELKRATKAKRISDTINQLSADIYEIVVNYGDDKGLKKTAVMDNQALGIARKIKGDYDDLKQQTIDDPTTYAVVANSEAAAQKAVGLLIAMKDSTDRAGESERDMRKPMWRELRSVIRDIVYKDLSNLGEEQKKYANRSPEIQAHYRKTTQRLMIAVAILNFGLTSLAAIFLTKGITQRLARVSDNTYKLASGLPLNPVIAGTDEIARLDQVFHSMAAQLREANRTERAIFENARDVIFSIDKKGEFKDVNRASAQIFGYEPSELLGTHFVDLVIQEDVGRTLEHIEDIKADAVHKPLEIRMYKKDRQVLDALLSAQWSAEDETMFCVVHDISDRRQAEKLRQEVVAMVTHDLRTPLATLKNILGFLDSGKFGHLEKQGEEYLVMADRNVQRMITLTNDLLDVEKIRSGRMKLERSSTSVSELFDECKQALTPLADQLGVDLVFEASNTTVPVDRPTIARVLENLVGNALKFSPKGTVVHIFAVAFGSEIHISVADQGPGIPKDKLENVFERFQKIDGVSPRISEGSGLGLAICKEFVALHSGRIWAESEIGKGSTFTFSLPLSV
jgi:PAS domain S-box-containing protein